jgi:hypothetical protein
LGGLQFEVRLGKKVSKTSPQQKSWHGGGTHQIYRRNVVQAPLGKNHETVFEK